MSERDKALVDRARAGDHQAFGDLVERYSPLVHGLLLESIRQPDVIEDLVQEVFCKAYEELSHLRHSARFAPWLHSIAVNTARDWLRRQQVRYQAEKLGRVPLLPHYTPNPEELFQLQEMADALWEAVDRLPPEQRRVVVLHYIEGCSYRDISRFLGVRFATVKWRLSRAQRRLKQDLISMHYGGVGYRLRSKREVRNKVIAMLPVVAFFRPEPPISWLMRWGRRLAVSLGLAGIVGILGVVSQDYLPEEQVDAQAGGRHGFRVRRKVVDLPEMSVFWQPRYPQRGDRVRVEAAGVKLGKDEANAELHYITDPWYPLDHAVLMAREGETWIAEIKIPPETSSVFFYISPREEGAQNLSSVAYLTTRKRLQRYRHFFLIYDGAGKPVRSASLKQGLMAERLEHAPDEILRHVDREIVRYPDNFNAYLSRWMNILEAGNYSMEAKSQVKAEQDTLIARYPNRPEAMWWVAQVPSDWQTDINRQLYQRFPDYERSDEAAYWVARQVAREGDERERLAALEEFIRLYPNSRYVDEVFRARLGLLGRIAPQRAGLLADSLIDRTLILSYDPEKEQDQRSNIYTLGGCLPEGYAYSLRFDLFLKKGKQEQAFALTRRLLSSGLRDPGPYLYIGEKLAGLEDRAVLYEDPPTYPQDVSLAIETLTVGLPLVVPENMLDLPGYNTYFDMPSHARSATYQGYLDGIYSQRQRFLQSLAACRVVWGEYREAVEVLEEARALREKIRRYVLIEDRILFMLGQTYERLEQWEKAEEVYLQAVRQHLGHPEAEVALERMHRERFGHLGDLRSRLQACYPPAPDFDLRDSDGRELRLSDLRGRIVLLYYDGGYGEKGRSEGRAVERLRQLKAWEREFAADGLGVLHICRHPDRSDSPFRMALDDDGVGDKYPIRTTSLFLIDQAGRLRLQQEYWENKKEEGQSREVEKKIRELIETGGKLQHIAKREAGERLTE